MLLFKLRGIEIVYTKKLQNYNTLIQQKRKKMQHKAEKEFIGVSKAIFCMNTDELIKTANLYIDDPLIQKLIDIELIERGRRRKSIRGFWG